MQGKRFSFSFYLLTVLLKKRILKKGFILWRNNNTVINFLQAAFVPSADDLHDTSYFMSRYIWNPEDENVNGGSDFELSENGSASCGSSSYSNPLEEEVNLSQI